MSFCLRPNVCKKCGKPLTLFEGWTCLECEKAEQEPCTDAVRREAVIKFEGTNMACMGGDEIMKEFENNTQQHCNDRVISLERAKKQIGRWIGYIDQDMINRICMSLDALPPVTPKPIECDDAISRILKRMWNCRGKHTTSIDKVKMEQIIRDELPSVTKKSGKWIKSLIYENTYNCSKCGSAGYDTFKYCPNCGAKMESEEV